MGICLNGNTNEIENQLIPIKYNKVDNRNDKDNFILNVMNYVINYVIYVATQEI